MSLKLLFFSALDSSSNYRIDFPPVKQLLNPDVSSRKRSVQTSKWIIIRTTRAHTSSIYKTFNFLGTPSIAKFCFLLGIARTLTCFLGCLYSSIPPERKRYIAIDVFPYCDLSLLLTGPLPVILPEKCDKSWKGKTFPLLKFVEISQAEWWFTLNFHRFWCCWCSFYWLLVRHLPLCLLLFCIHCVLCKALAALPEDSVAWCHWGGGDLLHGLASKVHFPLFQIETGGGRNWLHHQFESL